MLKAWPQWVHHQNIVITLSTPNHLTFGIPSVERKGMSVDSFINKQETGVSKSKEVKRNPIYYFLHEVFCISLTRTKNCRCFPLHGIA